jgi:carbon-monoxide dehydrogenase small subunit
LHEGRAVHECYALQCGFCTPGMLVAARDILRRIRRPDEPTVRHELSGHICRCTGYAGIVNAIVAAGQEIGGA